MKKSKKFVLYAFNLLLIFLLLPSYNIYSYSPGILDATFDSSVGANSSVWSFILQPDNKIIIAGSFSQYNGTARNRIARLNTDGSLDLTFDPGAGANDAIRYVAIQSDGKIVIAGAFTEYNGIARNRIARLNTDGSLDLTFDPGTGVDSLVRYASIQSDDKMIIAGDFSQYNGTARNRIARLNTDGSLDLTFDPGTGVDGLLYYIAIQPDNKIIIAGSFSQYNGTARNRIARLNTDGSLDLTFDPGIGPNASINKPVLDSNGKIIITGGFTEYSGTARNRIARLNTDGSLDLTFDPGTGANNWTQYVSMQSDDKPIIGGYFATYNGTARNRIARLNTDGSLDLTFDPGTGVNSGILFLLSQSDGKIVIAGAFTEYNGIARNRIARLRMPTVLTEVTPVERVIVNNNPISYTFNTDQAGTITYGGSCSSATTVATSGNNTITLNQLSPGTYSNCTITITDNFGNISSTHTIPNFDIVVHSGGGSSSTPTTSTTITESTINNTVTPPVLENTTTEVTTTVIPPTNTYTSPLDGTIKSCPAFTKYLRVGNRLNDKQEARLWQAFLNTKEEEKLTIDGIYGKQTESAIKRFQNKYKDFILSPWNLISPTGYTYKSTRAYANKLVNCSEGAVTLDNGKVINY